MVEGAALEMVGWSVSFVHLETPYLQGFAPVQKIEYFVVLSCCSALRVLQNFRHNIYGEVSKWS